jgi:DNA modification methylase
MFSFAGDTVLDPFAGSGSTAVAAIRAGRNSISVEIEEEYLNAATRRAAKEAAGRLIESHSAIVIGSRSPSGPEPRGERALAVSPIAPISKPL